MIVVSDTSPVTYLVQINCLHLLSLMYKKIIIPNQVFDELMNLHHREEDALQAALRQGWVEVHEVTDEILYLSLLGEIDPGESAAITLAMEKHADLLLIDERKGSQKAALFNIPAKGILGVLAEAKKQQLIPSFNKKLTELTTVTSFRISKHLLSQLINTFND